MDRYADRLGRLKARKLIFHDQGGQKKKTKNGKEGEQLGHKIITTKQ